MTPHPHLPNGAPRKDPYGSYSGLAGHNLHPLQVPTPHLRHSPTREKSGVYGEQSRQGSQHREERHGDGGLGLFLPPIPCVLPSHHPAADRAAGHTQPRGAAIGDDPSPALPRVLSQTEFDCKSSRPTVSRAGYRAGLPHPRQVQVSDAFSLNQNKASWRKSG